MVVPRPDDRCAAVLFRLYVAERHCAVWLLASSSKVGECFGVFALFKQAFSLGKCLGVQSDSGARGQ